MALLFFDSFDHYQTAQVTAKWTTITATPGPSIVAGVGRCGSQALRPATNFFQDLIKGIPFGSTTITVGLAVNYFISLFGPIELVRVEDGVTWHLLLSRGNDGTLYIVRNDVPPVVLGFTVPDVIRMNSYYYIELQTHTDVAAGTVIVRVNGVTVLNLAGLNTKGLGTLSAFSTAIRIAGASNYGVYIDDLYALDSTGPAPNNTLLGDVHAEYLQPQAPGFHQDWGVVGVPTHWQAVSDGASPDDDATYIFTTTVGAIDTEIYASTGLPSGSIFGVQLGLYARKTDAGVRLVAPVIRHAGADHVGANQAPSATSYHYLIQLYETNPGTGVAWTIADVNGDEYGIELTA